MCQRKSKISGLNLRKLQAIQQIHISYNVCPFLRILSGYLFFMCASRQARVSFLLRPLASNLIRVQNIVHYVGCPTKGHDVNLTLRVYFAPTNFTLSEYLASKHFGDSACLGLQNLRDSANLLKILFKVDFYLHNSKKSSIFAADFPKM